MGMRLSAWITGSRLLPLTSLIMVVGPSAPIPTSAATLMANLALSNLSVMSFAEGSRVVFLSSHHLDDIYFSRSWGTFGYLMDCNKVGMAS